MPYKRAAHGVCAVLDADARQAGAVNTLAAADGGLAGWCTDVAAVRSALETMPTESADPLAGAAATQWQPPAAPARSPP
jgi:shikimate 5-dehydrogenase